MQKDKEVMTPEREKELEEKNRQLMEALRPFSDNLPYDRNRVVNEAKFFINQAAQGIVEAGKRLILLKAQEGHGGFYKALEEIGIPPRTASRFMATADKLANRPTLTDLGKSKLYALLDVPDEELAEFEETGMLYGADRDEIDSWGVRQLKDFVRKQKKQIDKGTKQLEDKEVENAELKKKLSPPVTETDAIRKLTEAHVDYEHSVLMMSLVADETASPYAVRQKVALFDHIISVAQAGRLATITAREGDVDFDVADDGLELGKLAEKAIEKHQAKVAARAGRK